MQLPEVSEKAVAVIVPIYNRLDLLRATIESLRAQTLESAEFILVDDRSDAGVWNYLESLPLEDARFRVIRKPEALPRGCQSSRNIGLDAATASSVVFLDSDDLIAPRCLEDRYAHLTEEPTTDIVVGRQALFSSAGIRWVNVPRQDASNLDRFLDMAGRIDVPWINGGAMIRTSALRARGIRWRVEYHWDDVAFHFDCLVAGMRVRWMDFDSAPDSWYRSHDDDRYGAVLSSVDGIRNAARMFTWMGNTMRSRGELTDERSRSLSRSFFHFCVIQPIDQGHPSLASDLIAQAESDALVSTSDAARMRAYRSARLTNRVSSRMSAAADRFARETWVKELISESPATFCSIAPEAPDTESSLRSLLGAASGTQ